MKSVVALLEISCLYFKLYNAVWNPLEYYPAIIAVGLVLLPAPPTGALSAVVE